MILNPRICKVCLDTGTGNPEFHFEAAILNLLAASLPDWQGMPAAIFRIQ
jgi:hypothetical protein